MLVRSTHVSLIFGLALSLSLGGLLAACSDDSGGGGSGGGGTGGAGGSGGAGTGAGGQGGTGGTPGCGDMQADPANCGACGNVCAPGQTCEAGVCTCGADTASFSADVQPILTQRCATSLCHAGAMPKAGLDLTAAAAHGELTGTTTNSCSGGRALVVPGQPSDSYVVDKLLGVQVCLGKRMPPAAALPSGEIKTISDWICAGALDD